MKNGHSYYSRKLTTWCKKLKVSRHKFPTFRDTTRKNTLASLGAILEDVFELRPGGSGTLAKELLLDLPTESVAFA